MATTITESTRLACPPERVLALLADADFVQWRTSRNPGLAGEVLTHDVDDDVIRIETRAQMPGDWLPGRVRAAARALPSIYRREVWQRHTGVGETDFEITGVPAQASATMSVTPLEQGCELTQSVRIAVTVPLVAGIIEAAIAAQIGRALKAEAPAYVVGEPL